MKILVTGGAGFIGSSFLNYIVPLERDIDFVVLDSLTYASDITRLSSQVRHEVPLEVVDITDFTAVRAVFRRHQPTDVINFAAETHVDNSIESPKTFLDTNIWGTFNLLNACREYWREGEGRFHQISTDEVYGSVAEPTLSVEDDFHHPSSPYSASKSAGEGLVVAFQATYGVNTVLSRSANNYAPGQHAEKFIPKMCNRAFAGDPRKPLTLYGDGLDVRDFIHTEDNCKAIWRVFQDGRSGQSYNIPGNNPRTNLEVLEKIITLVAEMTGRSRAQLRELIVHTPDRPGHDKRYAMSGERMKSELGWEPTQDFDKGLREVVSSHLRHPPEIVT